MRDKQEWIKYSSHGGGRPVWHLPSEDSRHPACKSNGPINGKVESVCYVELIPVHGAVCSHCAQIFMNRIKLNLTGALKRALINRQLKTEVTLCPTVPTAKKP